MARKELPRIDRDKILAAVDIVEVIKGYGVDLKKSGKEWEACCPFHKDKSPSFKVVPDRQFYYCHGCGASGDAIRFVTDFEQMSFVDACKVLSGGDLRQVNNLTPVQRDSVKVNAQPEWEPIIPAPAGIPDPTFIYRRFIDGEWMEFPIQKIYPYRDMGSQLIGYVVRFLHPISGKKEPMPLVWARNTEDNREAWRWLSFPKPRPLYGLDRLVQFDSKVPVLLVEGEKCVDVATEIIGQIPTVSWPGGGKAIRYVDFSPLAGRKVILWRDADVPGYQTTYGWFDANGELNSGLVQILQEAGVAGIMCVEPPDGSPDGWDIADAIDVDGWDNAHTLAYIKAHAGKPLEPLPHYDGNDEEVPDLYEGEAEGASVEEEEEFKDPVSDEYIEVFDDEDDPYRPLGYDHGSFFYLAKGSRQVHELTASGHSKQALLAMAPLSHWEARYPGATSRVSWDMAINALMRMCEAEGIYDPDRIRGRGAWWDSGRSVLHLGSHLIVDGTVCQLRDVDGWHIYEHSRAMLVDIDHPLSAREAYKVIEICKMMQWEKPIDAYLFAGFIMLAAICGSLDWRPHIWLTGGGGTGKSWAITNILSRCLDGFALNALSSTTEAGIRQALGHDARPVIFDEAEGEDAGAQQRIQNIMQLMRQASSESGGEILKGSAGGKHQSFRIRSMFAFSSIGVAVHQYSDKTRVSVLQLRVDQTQSQESRADQFAKLEELTFGTLTDEFVQSLHARSIRMIGIIRENAKTFAKAGARVLGQQRLGDQIGALLAGAYALHSNNVVTIEEAQKWIEGQEWEEENSLNEQRDEFSLMAKLMSQQVKVLGVQGSNLDRTLGELVSVASALEVDPEVYVKTAQESLMRYGVKLSDDRQGVIISNQHDAIAKILRDSPWPNNWGKIIKRIPGAVPTSKTEYFGVGAVSRAVMVPITALMG